MNKKTIFVGCALFWASAVMICMNSGSFKRSSALTMANIHALTIDEVKGYAERVETTEEQWDYEKKTYSAVIKIDCKDEGETKCP